MTSFNNYLCFMTQGKINRAVVEALLQLCKVDGDINLNGIQWSESLIQLGIKHGVGAWCYYRIKNSSIAQQVPEETLKPWKQLYFQTSIVNQQKLKVYFEIQNLLKEVNIPVIGLKGIALAATVYPDEGLRPMGDIDLLVPEGEGLNALKVLLNAGATQNYVPRSALHEQVHAHVRAITYKGVLIEIHQRLFSLGNPYHIDIDYFNYTKEHDIGRNQMIVLDDVWFGYHLLAHAASNIYKGGLRFGWLVDIALLLNNHQPGNNYNLIENVNSKKKAEIDPIYQLSRLLCENIVNHSFPKDTLIEDLFTGIMKKQNDQRHKVININESIKVPGICKKVRLLWREIFPEKEYMIFRYNIENSKYWLLYFKRLWPF